MSSGVLTPTDQFRGDRTVGATVARNSVESATNDAVHPYEPRSCTTTHEGLRGIMSIVMLAGRQGHPRMAGCIGLALVAAACSRPETTCPEPVPARQVIDAAGPTDPKGRTSRALATP
jgi:hypothetical protein